MALTATEKREIEVMIRKEIKDFLKSNTLKQFEEKLFDEFAKEIKKRGSKPEGEIKELIIKLLHEFYAMMYTQRSMWTSRLKNA